MYYNNIIITQLYGVNIMSEKNTVKILLNGAEFKIRAEEDTDYIERISKIVDNRVMDVLNNTQNTNVYMATVVTALNYCDELVKEKISAEELKKEYEEIKNRYTEKEASINQTNKKLAESGLQVEALRTENSILKNQIDVLSLKLENLQNDLNDYLSLIEIIDNEQAKKQENEPTTQEQEKVQEQVQEQASNKIVANEKNLLKRKKINVRVVPNKRNKHISKTDYMEKDKINNLYKRDDFQDTTKDDDIIPIV